jgi:hypothetical protein
VLGVVEILPGLDQQPAVGVFPVVLVEIARRAAEFDDLIDLLEGQVERPATQPGHQLAGLPRAPRVGAQVVMDR